MSATTTQLLSSGEFCKLRYDTIHVKSASANVSFCTNISKMPNFELWHSCGKWALWWWWWWTWPWWWCICWRVQVIWYDMIYDMILYSMITISYHIISFRIISYHITCTRQQMHHHHGHVHHHHHHHNAHDIWSDTIWYGIYDMTWYYNVLYYII